MTFNQITLSVVMSAAAVLSACSITDTTSTTSASLDAATPDVSLNRFIDVRMASIRKEAAAGGGENLDAMAALMGRDADAFGPWMQDNYSELFDGVETSNELVVRIEKLTPQS
jgi:hypothetical protein